MRTDIKRPLTPDLKLFHSVRFKIFHQSFTDEQRKPDIKTVKKIKNTAIHGAYLKNMRWVFELINGKRPSDWLIVATNENQFENPSRNVRSRKVLSEKFATGTIKIIKGIKLILFIL